MVIYGREVIELYPWFADGTTGEFFQTATAHGMLFQTSAQNDYQTWDTDLKAGTYTVADLCSNNSNNGIAHLDNGGADLATWDRYAASPAYSQFEGASTIALVAGDITLTIATKHASSGGYYGRSTYLRLIRTGD